MLVFVSTVRTAPRCEMVAVTVFAVVAGIGIKVVLVWARQVAQRAMLGYITCSNCGFVTGLIDGNGGGTSVCCCRKLR